MLQLVGEGRSEEKEEGGSAGALQQIHCASHPRRSASGQVRLSADEVSPLWVELMSVSVVSPGLKDRNCMST